MQCKYFSNGYPVISTMAINSGEFKMCGEIMGMSVMQGGPGSHFLSPPVVAYITGKPLAIAGNKSELYKSTCERVSMMYLICVLPFKRDFYYGVYWNYRFIGIFVY